MTETMNLSEELLTQALEILGEDQFEEKLLALMATSGMKILDLSPDGHLEMEVAFWTAFTSVMLSPFEPSEHARILERYSVFLQAIFEEAAGLPLPTEAAEPEPEK